MTYQDLETSSDYETSSEYFTSEEENFNLKKINSNNQDIKLVDYSELNCGSCKEPENLNNILIISLLSIFLLVIFIFKKY